MISWVQGMNDVTKDPQFAYRDTRIEVDSDESLAELQSEGMI
jgi:hypothetical protein